MNTATTAKTQRKHEVRKRLFSHMMPTMPDRSMHTAREKDFTAVLRDNKKRSPQSVAVL